MDEKGHCDRDLKQEIKGQQKIEKELGCKFIRIDLSKENFDIIDEIFKIHHYIVELREKSLTKRISNTLLELEFKSNNSIKTKCLKWVVKNILPNLQLMTSNCVLITLKYKKQA